jgi:predicted methyltransferase
MSTDQECRNVRAAYRCVAFAGLALVALAACTGARTQPAAPAMDRATRSTLEAALGSPRRSEANRARDKYRHPEETLEFLGLRQDMTVLEVWPGAAGWWTEILAPVLRDHGRYIAASFDPGASSANTQTAIKAYRAKLDADPAAYGKVEVTALAFPDALHPVPDNSVDLVVTFRNLHNWMAREQAAPAMLKAMFAALKPGGILGVEDHRAKPDAPVDPAAKLGYVNESFAIELIKGAGFEFIGSSEVNANPLDTKDYELGVWTLPPTYRLGDKDRARFAAIGESDRFTLKFRKPLASH